MRNTTIANSIFVTPTFFCSNTITAKVNAEKAKVEKELKDATLKIVSLQDLSSNNESRFKVEISDLERTVKKLREDLKSAVLSGDAASKELNDFKTNREKDLAQQAKLRDEAVAAKEKEKVDLNLEWEEKERKLVADIARLEKEKEAEVERLNAEIADLNVKIAKKEDYKAKLEKEKREMAITKDKSLKRMESVEKEKESIKESLARLEAEKRANNFGKYEKEKMKAELEKAQDEKQKLSAKFDSVVAENRALQSRVDEMNKCGEKTQQELQTKNTSLSTKVAKLESGDNFKLQSRSDLVTYRPFLVIAEETEFLLRLLLLVYQS